MPKGVIAKVEAMVLAKDQSLTEDEISFEWAPDIPIDDSNAEVNIHQPDRVTQNNVESKQNNTVVNIKQEEETDDGKDPNDDSEDTDDQQEDVGIEDTFDDSNDEDTNNVVYENHETEIEDVFLDKDEQDMHADAVEMFPNSFSEEELRSKRNDEVVEEEFNDDTHELNEGAGMRKEPCDENDTDDAEKVTHRYHLRELR